MDGILLYNVWKCVCVARQTRSTIKKGKEKEKGCCAHDEVHGWLYLRVHVHRCLSLGAKRVNGAGAHSRTAGIRPGPAWLFDFKFMPSQLWAFLWPLASNCQWDGCTPDGSFLALGICSRAANGEIIIKENCFLCVMCAQRDASAKRLFFLAPAEALCIFGMPRPDGQHNFLNTTSSYLRVWIRCAVLNIFV